MLETVEGIDWVLIGSKNCEHREHCLAAFKAGKHVFCEKPLAITVEECEEITNAHKASGKLFATGFVLRHAPLYIKMYELIQSGILGKLVSVEADEVLTPGHGGYIMRNWRRFKEQGGPHILEKCCHDVDILNWLIGSIPRRVASFGGTDVFTKENRPENDDDYLLYTTWNAWEDVDPFLTEKGIVDNQVVIMEYRNNVRVTFHANCNSAWPQRRLMICGTKGTMEGNLIDGSLRYRTIANRYNEERIQVNGSGMHGGADSIIMDNLAESMFKGVTPKATGREGLLSAIVCIAVDEAMVKGQVVDVEPYWARFSV